MDTILYMLITLLDLDHALSCIAREDPILSLISLLLLLLSKKILPTLTLFVFSNHQWKIEIHILLVLIVLMGFVAYILQLKSLLLF